MEELKDIKDGKDIKDMLLNTECVKLGATCKDCDYLPDCKLEDETQTEFEKLMFDLQVSCKALLTNEVAMQDAKLIKQVSKMYLYTKSYPI